MSTTPPPQTDRLPNNMLVGAEVIKHLRLDYNETTGNPHDRKRGLRTLRTLRDTGRITYVKLGSRTVIYPRAAVEQCKKDFTVEASA